MYSWFDFVFALISSLGVVLSSCLLFSFTVHSPLFEEWWRDGFQCFHLSCFWCLWSAFGHVVMRQSTCLFPIVVMLNQTRAFFTSVWLTLRLQMSPKERLKQYKKERRGKHAYWDSTIIFTWFICPSKQMILILQKKSLTIVKPNTVK